MQLFYQKVDVTFSVRVRMNQDHTEKYSFCVTVNKPWPPSPSLPLYNPSITAFQFSIYHYLSHYLAISIQHCTLFHKSSYPLARQNFPITQNPQKNLTWTYRPRIHHSPSTNSNENMPFLYLCYFPT